MGLIPLASVSSLLICPRCGSALEPGGDSFRCNSPSCDLDTGWTLATSELSVLVDFEHSIVRRDRLERSAAPPARRWSIDRLPRGVRRLWKPVNRVAEQNVERLLSLLPRRSPLMLVVGGGTVGNGIEAIYTDPRLRVLAFDVYDSPFIQLIADAHQIPVASRSVDAVVVQAVLEHVLDPDRVVQEIRRVLRPGGLVYAETSFLQQVHAGPYDFTRYTSSGHRHLFRGFDEIAAGPVAGPGTQILWSVDHLVRGLLRSELAGKLTRGLFFWLRYLDRLVPTAFTMDNAAAYYFLGRRAERELTPAEIMAYYRGAQSRDRPG